MSRNALNLDVYASRMYASKDVCRHKFSKPANMSVVLMMALALATSLVAQTRLSLVAPQTEAQATPFTLASHASAKPFLLASLRPAPGIVWQRVKSADKPLEGPVLYQIIFRSSATPKHIPRIADNFTLTNSLISDDGTQVAIGGLSINPGGIISFANGQTFPGAGSVNSVTSGNSFITIGGTAANPTIALNTAASDGRYLQLSGGTLTGAIVFANGQTFPGTGTVTSVSTGAGLSGGPITSTGTISIANGGVTNAMLANSSVTINTLGGSGLAGGGSLSLGSVLSLNIANSGVTNTMLANPALTVSAGAGLAGGGSVALGGTTTLNLDTTFTNARYLQLNGGTLTGGLSGTTASFSGGVSGLSFTGDGSALTNVTANNALALGGNLAASYKTTVQNDLRYLQLNGGTLTGGLSGTTGSFSGGVNALSFTGDGSALTNVTANNALALGGNPAASYKTTAQNDLRYLQLSGGTLSGSLVLGATGTANAGAGAGSNPHDWTASVFNSGTGTAQAQSFRWQAEPVGNNSANPSGSFNLLFSGTGNNFTPTETGLSVASNGRINFAPGQTFPVSGLPAAGGDLSGSLSSATVVGLQGTPLANTAPANGQVLRFNGSNWTPATIAGGGGTVTNVGSGLGLTGGPITASGTLAIDTTVVPQLAANNTFTATNLFAAGTQHPPLGNATPGGGFNSSALDLAASSYNSGAGAAVNQRFRWQAEPVSNNSNNASGSLNLQFAAGNNPLAETGLSVANNGQITFAAGQTFPGSVASVTAGDGSITVAGTASAPTVAVANGGVTNSKLANPSLTVTAGAGLSGGGSVALGGSTTLSIASAGVTNAMLQNSSVTVNTGTGLSGGGTVALGGALSLSNTGVLAVGASAPLASSGGANPSISLTGTVPIANGGTGITTAPASAGQYLRSSGAGTWAVGGIQAGDVPSLSGTYVDLASNQTIAGNKIFSNTISGNISGNAATATTATTATTANNALALGGNPAASYNTVAQDDTRYLQLSGGTLTGGLNGTTASFNSNLQTGGALTVPVPNNGLAGTVLNQLAELTGAPSTAVNASANANTGTVGIVVSGAGTSGNAQVAILGAANCVFDGTTTAGDYVTKSTITGGNCHDAGSAYPTGVQVIGRVLSTNGAAGTYQVALFSAEERSNAGTVTSVGLSAPADFNVSGSPVTNTGTLALTWGVAPTASNTANAIVKRDATGNFSAGAVTATSFSGDGSALTNVNASQLGGQPAANYARLDIGNSFHGLQFINAGGLISLQDGQVNSSISGNFTFALDGSATGTSSDGVRGDASGPSGSGIAGFGDSASSIGGLFVNTSGGKVISGQAPFNNEVFSVDSSGNLFASGTGANTIVLPNDATVGTFNNGLAKLTTDNPSKAKASIFGDKSGVIGIVVSGGGLSSSATIVVAGRARCVFENAATAGDYVTIGRVFNAECFDAGSLLPTGEQVVGRVMQTATAGATLPVVLFGPEDRVNAGTVTSISGTAPIAVTNPTTTPNISITPGGITNALLTNSAVTVNAGAGLTGGGSVALGAATSLSANLNHDASLTGNGGSSALGIATGGVTNALLAANSVDSSKIVAGSIVDANVNATANIQPAKIAGTAATLSGSNAFSNTNSFTANTASALVTISQNGSGNALVVSPGTTGIGIYSQASTTNSSPAIEGNSFSTGAGIGVEGIINNGTGVGVQGQSFAAGATAGAFISNAGGKILSGQNNSAEVFSVDTNGNMNVGNASNGPAAITTSVPNEGTTGTTLNRLAKLTGAPSKAIQATATDTGGIIGIVIASAGTTGNAQIAVLGQANCQFDGATLVAGDYVVPTTAFGVPGDCHDAGANYPAGVQVIGRVLASGAGLSTQPVVLFGPEQRRPNPPMMFSVYIAASPNGFYGRFNPDQSITVTRLSGSVGTPSAGCTSLYQFGVFGIGLATLSNGTGFIDSGPVSVNVSAGTTFSIVAFPGGGCTTIPADINVSIEYKLQ